MDKSQFRGELESAINRASKENGSDTPDFILATFLDGCLAAFDEAVTARERWYGRGVAPPGEDPPKPGAAPDEDLSKTVF